MNAPRTDRRPRRVCIIQPVMKRYRAPFFLALEERLARANIGLGVVYGTPWRGEAERGDHVDLPAPLGRKVESTMLLGRLLLMPTLKPWLQADLVVVEHANKHLLNYPLAALQAMELKRLAYWGHGRDRQADAHSLGERFKRRTLHWADWWFAYTAASAHYVAAQGYPAERITVVENAVDTRALREELSHISAAERNAARAALGWNAENPIALYCGSLYANKRLDLLFAAADQVQAAMPAFRLLIIGGGPLDHEVKAFVASRPWARAVGPKFGRERSVLLSLGCMWLNPGALGLAILDAFCAGLPLLTTHQTTHGPEIEYLQHEENGLLLSADATAYAGGILRLLREPALATRLQAGARAAAQRYSIETMAANFAAGVQACLSRC